ncbi:YsnF/AvaK domain-containing protein [Lichenibacterium dinghuense]|uniref:YsnF/AvaK domain-containing protein n=1 Tax=Lichenibacterium dinghuense TaxID=2895977 RepID=UPI001F1BA560|nr:YsnF/AvaK domain-containing protein [Lichenibacterium sp. 6Y81]
MAVPPRPDGGFDDLHGSSDAIPVVEERLSVSKRRRSKGRVRISTRTEVHRAFAEAELDGNSVAVTRVLVGRVVDSLPPVRNEGTTTIVPVVEERLVLMKQLYLTEELHIHQEVTRSSFRQPVDLRRQRVLVERIDPESDPS